MKIIERITFLVLTILLFTNGISSQTSTIVGDIIIRNENESIYCDSMICPPSAIACHVTKRNNPNDFLQIVRNRKCFDKNGTIIAEQTIYEPNLYQDNVNIKVVSGGGSPGIIQRQLTPQEQRQLEENLNRIQEQVAGSLSNLHESLRPLQDGSFATNLRNRIDAEVRDSLKNSFPF